MATMSPALLALVKGAKNKYGRSEGKAIKPKEGKTTIRILPFQVEGGEPGQFWFETGVHWIKTETNGKPVAVTGCHAVVYSTPCPVCAAIEAAKPSAVSDEDVKLIKDWNAKKGVLIQVLLRSGSDASEDNVQIMELTPTTFAQVMSIMEEYAEQQDITDIQTGMNLVIERSGKGLDTKYQVMTTPSSKPVPKATMDKCIDLKAFVEKEFFRGEDVKALTAISNMTGISLTGITAPRTSALLTSSAARVAGSEVTSKPAEPVVPAPSAADRAELAAIAALEVEDDTPPFVVDAPAEDDEEAAMVAQLAAMRAKKAAAVAKPAVAAKAPAPKKVAPAPAPEPEDTLSEDDVASVLAELDNI